VVSRIMKDGEPVHTGFAGETIIIDSKEQVGIGSKVLKTLDYDLVRSLDVFLDPDYKLIPLTGFAKVIVGKPLWIQVVDDAQNKGEIKSDYIVLPALNAPATKVSIENQLLKLGNTPFFWASLSVETDEIGFVPVKALNELRRLVIEKITEIRIARRKAKICIMAPLIPGTFETEPFELIAKIRTIDQLEVCLDEGIKTIYFEDTMTIDKTRYPGISFFQVKRRIWPDSAKISIEEDSVVSDVGSIVKNQGHTLVGDNFLNVTNIYTANLLSRSGLKSITLSMELHQESIRYFSSYYAEKFGVVPNLELIVYGQTELMISKYCPIAKTMGTNTTHCHLCEHHQYALKDRMDYEFALVNDGDCNIRVLNPKPLCLIDYVSFLKEAKISKIRIDFTIEDKKETAEIVKAFRHALSKKAFLVNRHNMTYGRFLK